MTKQEKINEINTKHNTEYKLTKSGRIYTTFMGKKLFTTLEKIQENINHRNAVTNSNLVNKFIKKNGGELINSSNGSVYYIFKGYKVRVSDHDWTSNLHFEPDYNLCSYKENGHIEMITELNNL